MLIRCSFQVPKLQLQQPIQPCKLPEPRLMLIEALQPTCKSPVRHDSSFQKVVTFVTSAAACLEGLWSHQLLEVALLGDGTAFRILSLLSPRILSPCFPCGLRLSANRRGGGKSDNFFAACCLQIPRANIAARLMLTRWPAGRPGPQAYQMFRLKLITHADADAMLIRPLMLICPPADAHQCPLARAPRPAPDARPPADAHPRPSCARPLVLICLLAGAHCQSSRSCNFSRKTVTFVTFPARDERL